MAPDDPDKIDFLLERYGQISQKHSHTNLVIHRTFYFSLVIFGALFGFLFQLDDNILQRLTSGFGAAIFLALWLWTRSYINGRNDFNNQQKEIIKELDGIEYKFESINSIGDIFPERLDGGGKSSKSKDREWWEEKSVKNRLLQSYYIALMIGFVLLATRYYSIL